MIAIGVWTGCTAALSYYGIDRMSSFRAAMLAATHPTAAPSVSPSASPSPSPGEPRVLRTPGGSIVASCDVGMVWVQWLSPADGYRVQDADQAPGKESRVTFKTDGKEVRVVVRCDGDGPHADVTPG